MTERLERIAVRAAVAIAVSALVAAAFWQHWRVLAASPLPVGVDGYFYPIQVRHILEHGTLQYPSSPLTFYWMAPFAAATDPIVGAKLGAALGLALIAVPAYFLGARLANGSRGAGLISAALAATSAGAGFLAIEFVKQGIGLAVALGTVTLYSLYGVEGPETASARGDGNSSRRRGLVVDLVVALVAIGLAFATHKMAGAIATLVIAPAAIVRARHVLHGRRLIYATLGGLALVVVLLGIGIAAPQRLLSFHDLALVADAFTRDSPPGVPALVMPGQILWFDHEAMLGCVVAVAAACVLVVGKPLPVELRASAWMIVALAIVIGLPLDVSDPQGLGFRLRIAAFVPLALCAAICAGELGRQLVRILPCARELALVALAAVLAIRGLRADRTEGEVLTHPALAEAVAAANGHIPDGATVIVPERHILFMVDWYTRAPVRLRPESIAPEHRVRMMGLVYIGGPDAPLALALDAARTTPDVAPPIALHTHHRNGLVLVTEPTWVWLLAHVDAVTRDHFAAWPTL